MRVELGLLFLVAACGGGKDNQVPVPGPAGECIDTWESWTSGFLRTWCTACHSAQLGTGARYGAPAGIDFDTYADAVLLSGAIESAAGPGDGESAPRMPPVGGPTSEERARLVDWIACGMPGEETAAVSDCADLADHAGDTTVSSEADAIALCAEAGTVSGDLMVSGSADLSCLCEVSGSVLVSEGDVDLSGLRAIGGDFVVGAGVFAFELDTLAFIGGDVLVRDAVVQAVRFPKLVDVGGSLTVTALPEAARVDISRLTTVGGSVELSDMPRFEVLLGEGYALEQIGGDLVLDDLDSWSGFYGFAYLETIGGDLRITNNNVMPRVDGFTALASVNNIIIEGNVDLVTMDGFDLLAVIDGDLRLAGNLSLGRQDAFALLESIGGSLTIANNPTFAVLEGWGPREIGGDVLVEDLDGLNALELLPEAVTIGGSLTLRNAPQIQRIDGLQQLTQVGGPIRFEGLSQLDSVGLSPTLSAAGGLSLVNNAALVDITGLADLRTVTGNLEIVGNSVLSDVTPLHGVSSVTGDLIVLGNTALPAASAQALEAAIATIGGDVTVSGNGS